MKTLLLTLFVLVCSTWAAGAEKIVFKETFDNADALKKYRIVRQKNGVEFTVEKNTLFVHHKDVPHSGFIEIPIPMIKKGRLDFDVIVNAKRNISNGIGLTLDLYNISTFWHDACNDWRMYFPEPNAKRMLFFNIEPVGHQKIAAVKDYVKKHYRIRFDEEADLVEFYVDDMTDPTAARYDVSVFGHSFYQGGYLKIGSFGYAPEPYVTAISNIVLTEEIPEKNVKNDKKLTLLMEGMTSQHYPVKKLLAADDVKNIRQYTFDSPGHCDPNTNNYQYFKLPGFESVANAKYIIFNDAPNVHDALQKKILESVNDGAKLLIMGGFYSLNRGGFMNSRLGNALPVVMDKIWNLGGSDKKPLEINSDGSKAEIYYYLDLKAAADAKVLMYAGNVPLFFQKKYGKGTITVFTGLISGPVTKNIYWKTPVLQKIFTLALK